MNVIYLFPRGFWPRPKVDNFMQGLNVKYKLRSGYGHLVAISEQPLSVPELASSEEFYIVGYDKVNGIAENLAYKIGPEGFRPVPIEELLDLDSSIQFDLVNFGHNAPGTTSLVEQYDAIRAGRVTSDPNFDAQWFEVAECRDIIATEQIDGSMRRLILDFYTLRASTLLLAVRLNSSDPLWQYAAILSVSVATRAQIEKLMLLAAQLEPNMEYDKLDRSKRRKATFLKQASEATLASVKELVNLVESVDLLDDNFRTPEVHKLGRVLGLVEKNHFDSSLNEILSFQKLIDPVFVQLCQYLRQVNSLEPNNS